MRAKNVITTAILAAAKISATANGNGVDIGAFEGDVKFTLDSSAGVSADDTLDVTLEHSDDNVTFTAITGGAFAQVTNAGAAFESIILSADGLKQYVRGVDTLGGASPEFSRSLQMVGEKKYS